MKPLIAMWVFALAAMAQAPNPKWESCAACHEDLVNSFTKNRHAGAKQACDSCHGNTAKHAETADPAEIRNPRKMTGKAGEATCLACHKNQATHVGRVSSGHGRSEVACTSCHNVHASTQPAQPKDRNAQCMGCHTEARAQFSKPFAHKVQQGQVNCVDCHNPHGTFQPKALASTARHGGNEPGCLKCHTDKRGPFRYEHTPVRIEACSTCHEPHGSVNPRMLTRSDVSQQCLECHVALPVNTASRQVLGGIPPAFHNIRDPFYRNCTVCHTKIHGSHVSKALLK